MAENSVTNSNRIVAETKIKGEILSQSDFRIDGEIEGTIQTTGRLVVGRTGVVRGKIICTNADIEGLIQGTLIVKNTLSLKTSAVIEGEVQTEKLAVEPGAVFNVKCSMGPQKDAPKHDEPKKDKDK